MNYQEVLNNMKKLQIIHDLGKIRIRQYWDDSFKYGEPQGTYFTATIDGWRGFKFITKDLKIQPLFEKTREYCNKVLEDLKINGTEYLSKYPNVIIL
jgi:hypothetical protein